MTAEEEQEMESLRSTIDELQGLNDDLRADLQAARGDATEWEEFANKLYNALDDIAHSAKEAIK